MASPALEDEVRRWLALLFEIADRADAIALDCFGRQDLRIDTKPDRTLVTEADLAIESEARAIARRRVAGLTVLGEEEGTEPDRGSGRLVIDPIDATANFVRGIPIFATLLAIEREDRLLAAVVSAPALGARWHAGRGSGAFRGERRLQVSGIRSFSESQMFHGSLAGREAAGRPARQLALLESSHRQRGFGDFYQHVLVSEGAGELAVDVAVSPWDIAPLILIAEEAGGRATGLDGSVSIHARSLLTTNGHLHEEALRFLAG
jgi:histidinol-phosphatase